MEQYRKTIAEAEEKIKHLQKMYLQPPPARKATKKYNQWQSDRLIYLEQIKTLRSVVKRNKTMAVNLIKQASYIKFL